MTAAAETTAPASAKAASGQRGFPTLVRDRIACLFLLHLISALPFLAVAMPPFRVAGVIRGRFYGDWPTMAAALKALLLP